jgi:VIT1/CCC1 family predicted Fe2+/Mn2+ transporter
MREILKGRHKRILDPMDRLSEVLFGLIMVLTITGSLSIAEAGRSEVRSMLIGALGCNIAWGIVDAVMYLLARLSEQGRNLVALRALRTATEPGEVRHAISEALPPLIVGVVRPSEWEELRRRLKKLPEPPDRPRLTKDDWLGATAVFLLVFLATLPVVVPFVLLSEHRVALRISNAIAVTMLFAMGYRFGGYAGYPSLRMGFWMVLLGAVLVGITMALGG